MVERPLGIGGAIEQRARGGRPLVVGFVHRQQRLEIPGRLQCVQGNHAAEWRDLVEPSDSCGRRQRDPEQDDDRRGGEAEALHVERASLSPARRPCDRVGFDDAHVRTLPRSSAG